MHQDYTHSLNYFGINSVLITLTLTPLIVLGISFKSVIRALWDYTCTPEIALTLLNSFQINLPKITLTLTLLLVSLRAKGTLISEPRFSTPCEMRFLPREKGKMAFFKKNPQQRPFSLSRVGEIASRRG